ncbi:MAG: hypothetical protein U9Q15_04170 [Patescibacteria group bacterium]|nr:hypothetical protein [Patescibacteria group bacterium]
MSASVSFLGAAYQIPGSIHGVWEIMLYIVNIFFILILAIAAFMNVLGVQLDTYAVKKILPKFIVIAITVNFSYALIVFIMNIAEIGYTLLPQLIFNVGSAINDDLKFTIGKILDLNSYMDISKIFLVDQDNLKTFSFTVQLCVGFFFIIMLIRPYATLTFILATRILALWALIITAPFAFLAYILPNTKSLWDKWWSGLLSVAFIPVKVFTLLSLIYVAVFTFRDELLLWANTVGNTVVSTADGLS